MRMERNALVAGERHAGTERRLMLLLYVIGVLVFRAAIMDDTFIHLQYARNLRSAGELAFNPGEPSMGATSPLWVLVLAASGVGVVGARVLSVASGALAVLVFGALARRVLGRGPWAVAASCAWAGSLWLVRHAPNGMETTAAVLLVLVAVWLRSMGGRHGGRDALVGLSLAGAVLTRPEAVLLGLVFVVQDAVTRSGRERLLLWLPVFVVPCVGWAAFAHSQTGDWLPATGAAKSGGLDFAPLVWWRVVWREARILGAGHAVELLGLAVGSGLALRLEGRAAGARLVRHRLVPYGVFSLLLLAGYAATDTQVQPRYLLLATPCLVLAGFAAWAAVVSGGPGRAALVCVASLAVGAFAAARSVYPATRDFAIGVERVLEPMALDVASRELPQACVAVADIGIMGYYSKARILDLGGLVDARVQALVARTGYDAMLEQGTFLDLAPVDFVLDRSTERERFRDHVTRGLHWRVLRTGVVRGLGISRPENYYYTLYALEPGSALGRLEPGATPTGSAARAPSTLARR